MKRPPAPQPPSLADLTKQQAHATVASLCAIVAASAEAGTLDAERFVELLARYTVMIYGNAPPPEYFLRMTETIARAAINSSGDAF